MGVIKLALPAVPHACHRTQMLFLLCRSQQELSGKSWRTGALTESELNPIFSLKKEECSVFHITGIFLQSLFEF